MKDDFPKSKAGSDALITPFLDHAVLVIASAILALVLPLYSINATDGTAYTLTSLGWVGNDTIPWIFGIAVTQDYSFLIWSVVFAIAAAGGLAILAWKQQSTPASLWGTLAAVAVVPLLAACVMLAADQFPMAYATATIASLNITATAMWGVPLWAITLAFSCTVAGTAKQVLTTQKSSVYHPQHAEDADQSDLEDLECALLERTRPPHK